MSRCSLVRLAIAAAGTAALLANAASATAAPHAAAPHAAAPHAAAPSSTRNVIVQLFDWPWTDIANECTNVLGPDGYGAVQISPPQEAVVLQANGYPWWQAYQPVAYDLNSRFGEQAQLQAMIATCHTAGVKVYADVVLNHMTGQGNGGTGDSGTTFTDKYDYPGLYSPTDFHSCETSITNWDDEQQVWNCQLSGLADLNTSSSYVQATEAAYLNTLISLGVDGFRWDAAKEMDPADIGAIEARLTQQAFVYQEVPWGSGQPVTPDLYTGNGDVMEFRYGWELHGVFSTGQLATLQNFGSSGMLPSADSVVFIDNQDTERDGSMLSYAAGSSYILANVFMLAWNYGTPEVLSDYAFSSYDQGPPSAGGDPISSVTCNVGTWECEDRWPAIAGMVGWHNAVGRAAGTAAVANWWTDGSNAIAFSRGSTAWVAINNESSPVTQTFTTGLPAGTYCDVISGAVSSGACTGTVVTVNAAPGGGAGQATVTVPAHSAVAIDTSSVATAATETVTVTVPASTPASGTVYLAGNLSALGEGAADWAPAGIAMTPLSATQWTATISATAATTLSYKFTLGSWATVEETSACGYEPNRSMPVSGGAVSDTVSAWTTISPCLPNGRFLSPVCAPWPIGHQRRCPMPPCGRRGAPLTQAPRGNAFYAK
jgi:alpha-amylase